MNPQPRAVDTYKLLCWLAGEIPSAKVIRDMLRKEREGT